MRKIVLFFGFISLIMLAACGKKVDLYEIELESNTLTLYVDQEVDITCTIKVNGETKSIAYFVDNSDNDVVSVVGQTILALKEGTATLTYYLIDFPDVQEILTVTVVPSLSIVNNQGTYPMYVNDVTTLTAIDRADVDSSGVVWLTSRASVATATNGNIIARSVGEATISVISVTTGKRVDVQVVVTERGIETVTINDVDGDVNITDDLTLLASITPIEANQSVTWATSDATIATINTTGVVSFLDVGEVTFTATSTIDPTKQATITITVVLDPIGLFASFHVDSPLRQYVTTFGYNPDQRFQWVNGSVTQYFFSDMNYNQQFVPIDQNIYTGQTATPAMLDAAEPLKLVRPGILHPETKYIIYHDTGNHTPGANAAMHAAYMVGAHNRGNRARSWHYTVDEHQVIHHIPNNEVTWQGDSFESYGMGIGIETCVDFGSDLYTTWQRTAKLMASLLVEFDLGMDAILQHYDTSGKNCPQALRMAGLYPHAISLVNTEYLVLKYLSDYTITFTSLNEDYVDSRGRVIQAPATATRVGYIISIEKDDYSESRIFYSTLKGLDGTTSVTLEGEQSDFDAAYAFDSQVAQLPKVMQLSDEAQLNVVLAAKDALTDTQLAIVGSLSYLEDKVKQIHTLHAVSTTVLMQEIMMSDNTLTKSGYIKLYNPTSQDVSLANWTLQYATKTGSFSIDPATHNTTWYAFSNTDVIRSNGYFLVQVGDGNHENGLYLPLPDAITNIFLESDGKIALTNTNVLVSAVNNAHVIDFVGYGDVTLHEGLHPAPSGSDTFSLFRRFALDTNDNLRDFIYGAITPVNSNNQTLASIQTDDEKAAMAIDLRILSLPRELTLDDEDLIIALRTDYTALTSTQKALVQTLDVLVEKEFEIEGLQNPDLAAINQAIRATPSQIIFDFTLSTDNGASWAYKAGEDTSYFDIVTGTYLKLTFAYTPITFVVSSGPESKETIINFGVLQNTNQKTVFSTGALAPAAGGRTADGMGSFAEQEARVGFGGHAIVVGDNVYFNGYSTYIPLSAPASGSTLTMNDLRPFGSSTDATATYNQALIKGVPAAYAGTGALYHNTSNIPLSFDPSFTYGRNNSGNYGYFKVVFSPNPDGSYTVKAPWLDSGTNTTTLGRTETLLPGEFLWTPHTHEANQGANGGTWLTPPGSATITPVLAEGTILSIYTFKTDFS